MTFTKRHLIKIILLAVCLMGCDRNKSTTNNIKTLNIDVSRQKANLSSVFNKEVDYIPLELTENSQIGFVAQVIWRDDRIYVLDSFVANALFVFDTKGKFLFQIGRKGKGPGEYTSPRQFQVSPENGNIYIYDSRVYKIIQYSKNGDVLKELALNENIMSFSLLENETLILDRGNKKSEKNQPEFKLHAVDMDGNLLFTCIEVTKKHSGKTISSSNVFSSLKHGISYVPCFSTAIYHQQGESMIPVYNLDFGSKKLDDIDLSVPNQGNWLIEFHEKGYPLFPELFETEEYIHMTFRIGNFQDGYKSSFFYRKESGKSVSFSDFSDDIGCGQLNVVGIFNDNTLIGSVEPTYLIDNKEASNDSKLTKLTSEDNPVLVKIRLRDF